MQFFINMLILLESAAVTKEKNFFFLQEEKESKLYVSLWYDNSYDLLTKVYFVKLSKFFSDKFSIK